MIDWLRFVLAVFAVYRLAQLVAIDDGPFAIFSRLRGSVAQWSAGVDTGSLRWTARELIKCPYCLGVWFGAFAVLPVWFPTAIGDLALLALGIAGGQCFLQDFSRDKE